MNYNPKVYGLVTLSRHDFGDVLQESEAGTSTLVFTH